VPAELDELPARIRSGDATAFRTLVEAVSPALVRVAARIVGDVALAEDVVQDGLVRAYQAMIDGSFQGRARVETWLYRIVTNAAIDARRRRRRLAVLEIADVDEAAAGAESRLALRELASWLDALPERQRTALVLSVFEGLSQREIAEIQGCSEGAVEQRLVRARATLRSKGVPT
jgi:RNA polymerase sigma-70 factor (ECF subfamily)